MVYKLGKTAKAVVAGLGAGAAAVVQAAADGSLDLSDGLTVLGAVLAVYGITWFVPNKASS